MENKVKLSRVEKNLTQQQLANQVGVTRQTISLIEKGSYNPSLNLCLEICYAVGKTLDEVFWNEKGEN
ncbi:helix-turn-helix transcriptional regulator [Rossellomorea sp. SC111]|uniref:helix-turn-helix transcriptional regulator n=1 Tax=Rossellomorea sp. SC111 TaxID=2968985 RepID=UPI00215AD740|nr:helix-turn-helix transcriptional regulator [Rossellomorea sp. SC111]MCR8848008.1 helix-turn-helix transcriptional regulator [Rossellomorea sp. SC111]